MLTTAGTPSAQALGLEPGTWTIDPAHSLFEFSTRHFTVARVKGRFTRFSGTVQVDPDDLLKSTVDVTIDASSAESQGVEKREELIRGEELLQTDQYPTISFRSKRIDQVDLTHYVVTGDLTLHGTTKEVEVPLEFGGAVVTRMGPRAGFSGSLTISRREFGVPFDRDFEPGKAVVGDDVRIELEIELVPQQPASA